MRAGAALLAIALAACAVAQQRPFGNGVIKIPIYHADPWAVKALLQGTTILSPEISTLLGFAGVPDQESELIKQTFGEGRFVVNPTDNSLWWYPKRAG